MDLSVIIVNYNVKYYLEQCLRSVFRASKGLRVEVLVVDNLSTDGSVPYLKERFPEVVFIENKENVGFARANNQAIRLAVGKYVLLLNPDTIVAEHTFTDFVCFMNSHPEAGGAGACMLRTDGSFALESRRGLPTPFVAFCKMSGLATLFPRSRVFGRYYMCYLDENESSEIEVISGAYMFLRREVLDNTGFLDEDFFMYGEDIDLSYRILNSGYKNYYLPSLMLHYKGESTVKSSYRYVYTFYQAMQLFFNKHYAHYSIFVSVPIRIAIWARSILAYIGNQFRHRNKSVAGEAVMNMLVMGDKQMIEEVRDILKDFQPNGTHLFIEATGRSFPEGHLSAGIRVEDFDFVVYDSDSYSYDTILHHLASTPGHSLRLATYSTNSKVLIGESFVKVYNS